MSEIVPATMPLKKAKKRSHPELAVLIVNI